ncbi:M23 family metallopeptidase [Mycolicibacterium holsaticum]|uniref:M23 family metallopeptidase n=1 Tax=Mycolicibacterium holsaticum TaxID=152142 RepID=UPI001C7CAE11|nr:M23 family metallopeptidase [Mycolicibacterium holsaticum]MDA4106169.1 membrane protein [Mycolicibacterium holsaticum DSM 44478 = JCM 12374]QZA13507.1 M23 family metallopeptidase [Mycolicibacterium holsaticum DSM 44478 = JCM 12374]UNC09028.1 M23 family metallopeptidase [Mycolicibacterium holsaticum DSM 44478 = JCM 12374]
MAAHRSSRFPDGASTKRQKTTRGAESPAEVTDIIPFDEFGKLADVDFRENCAFDRESAVFSAPELDDLHDTDDQSPLHLAVPSEFAPASRHQRRTHAYRDSHTDTSDGMDATDVINIGRRGVHRKPDVPVKGRLVVAAMAVGATAAGAYSMTHPSAKEADATVLAADQSALAGGAITGSMDGMQIVSVTPAASAAVHTEEIQKAAAFAQERAEREARLQRPMFVMPTRGVWTSGFGYRWGVLHGGIDIANSIGTPILAASDGVVVSAGPYAGYGNMVKLRHSDGSVTLYGHLSAVLVNVGQRVWAGDQIAKMGNTGNSTGPHLHFEVLMNGTDRVDPVGWLAKRGLSP